MTDAAVFHYLYALGQDRDRLATLRHAQKAVVMADARAHGYAFDETAFDATLWQTEIALAERIGEPFDFACSMWETMWGKTYLEYLALTVAPVTLTAFHAETIPSPTNEKS